MDSDNEFLELSSTETNFIASSSVLIGGSQRKVSKIMMYKRCWIQRNYFDPLKRITGNVIIIIVAIIVIIINFISSIIH